MYSLDPTRANWSCKMILDSETESQTRGQLMRSHKRSQEKRVTCDGKPTMSQK